MSKFTPDSKIAPFLFLPLTFAQWKALRKDGNAIKEKTRAAKKLTRKQPKTQIRTGAKKK